MVDAARSEARLRDGEPIALAPEQIVGRHAYRIEMDLRLAIPVGIAEHMRVAPDTDTGGIRRNDHHRLLRCGDASGFVLPITGG